MVSLKCFRSSSVSQLLWSLSCDALIHWRPRLAAGLRPSQRFAARYFAPENQVPPLAQRCAAGDLGPVGPLSLDFSLAIVGQRAQAFVGSLPASSSMDHVWRKPVWGSMDQPATWPIAKSFVVAA